MHTETIRRPYTKETVEVDVFDEIIRRIKTAVIDKYGDEFDLSDIESALDQFGAPKRVAYTQDGWVFAELEPRSK